MSGNDPHSPESSAVPIGIRHLRSDVAALVRRAGAGEHIVVSVAGRPVAQLGPLTAGGRHLDLDDLVARGLVIAARRSGPLRVTDPIPVWQGARIDRLLRDVR
jgi:antitoxin (DNA-binding transcriptional repressor) of toxin-antitoxin stability system